MEAYLEAQKKGRLDKFWLEMWGAWFQEWPEHEDMSIVDPKERAVAHTATLEKQKKYLKCWFPNHSKKTRVNPYGRLIKQALDKKKPTRRPQHVQLFCKLYYGTLISPLVRADMKRLTLLNGVKPSRGVFLKLLRKHSQRQYKKADPSVKDAVSAEFERREKLKEEKEKEPEPKSPAAYAAAIDDISAHFSGFSQILAELTGWSFTLLAGGPDPRDGGSINTISVHHGKNHAGLSFGNATPNLKEMIGVPYAMFLHSVYTPAPAVPTAVPTAWPPTPNVASPVGPITDGPPPLGDFDYDFSWDEFNLVDPLDPLESLDNLEKTNAFGGYPSLTEQLMAPLPSTCLTDWLLVRLVRMSPSPQPRPPARRPPLLSRNPNTRMPATSFTIQCPTNRVPQRPLQQNSRLTLNRPQSLHQWLLWPKNKRHLLSHADSPPAPDSTAATDQLTTLAQVAALDATDPTPAQVATPDSAIPAAPPTHQQTAHAQIKAVTGKKAGKQTTGKKAGKRTTGKKAGKRTTGKKAGKQTGDNVDDIRAAPPTHQPTATASAQITAPTEPVSAKAATGNKPRKRTRDNPDERLIVPGRRVRKAKARIDDEGTSSKGKEN
ncbi:hypothetical protein EYR38_006213 [Pleurotus pulmonarius]|nr:hypothetical protein EYR38_002727 [Pleurotus pulmonarius]KAF4597822.1 hypothetical protein EYR38_006213 [Pleurotus pulmonarius]